MTHSKLPNGIRLLHGADLRVALVFNVEDAQLARRGLNQSIGPDGVEQGVLFMSKEVFKRWGMRAEDLALEGLSVVLSKGEDVESSAKEWLAKFASEVASDIQHCQASARH